MSLKQISILGTGTIGACLATLAVCNSLSTVVIGHSQSGMLRCRETVAANLRQLGDAELLSVQNQQAALRLLTITDDWRALSGSELVLEAVKEELQIKRSALGRAEGYVAPEVPLLSCTSALLPEDLAAQSLHPERILVAHPFQPAHLQPLVELVGHEKTPPELLDRVASLLERDLARQVVRLKRAVPGFLVNRIAQAMFRECLSLLEQDLLSPADVDKAVRYAVGMRYASIGLLEYFDDVGFALEAAIARSVYPSLCCDPEVQPIVLEGLKTGNSGLKAGRGLYDWSKKDIADYQFRKTAPFLQRLSWNLPE